MLSQSPIFFTLDKFVYLNNIHKVSVISVAIFDFWEYCCSCCKGKNETCKFTFQISSYFLIT